MKKEILNEVNRAREIMGLAQLISEQLRVQTPLANTAPGVISRFILKTGASLPESVKFLQNFAETIDPDILPLTRGESPEDIFGLIISALLSHHGGGTGSNNKLASDKELRSGLELLTNEKREADLWIDTSSFSVYKHPKKGGIASHGNLIASYGGNYIDYERATNTSNSLTDILQFVNSYNLMSYASGKGERKQYLLQNMIEPGDIQGLGTGNFVDLSLPPEASSDLNLYSTTEARFQEISKQEKEIPAEEEAGYEADGKYNQEYEYGKHIPKDNKEIDRAILEIAQLFTPEVLKNITNFTVTSSASDEWGRDENNNPIRHGASEGQGDPGVGTDNKTKNEYLAYQRGKYFLDEVVKGLKSKGHPGLPSVTINWKVQEGGPEKRFIDINLNAYKEAIKGKPWIEVDYDFEEGKDVKSVWKKGTVYHYELDLELKSKKFLGITTKKYE